MWFTAIAFRLYVSGYVNCNVACLSYYPLLLGDSNFPSVVCSSFCQRQHINCQLPFTKTKSQTDPMMLTVGSLPPTRLPLMQDMIKYIFDGEQSVHFHLQYSFTWTRQTMRKKKGLHQEGLICMSWTLHTQQAYAGPLTNQKNHIACAEIFVNCLNGRPWVTNKAIMH